MKQADLWHEVFTDDTELHDWGKKYGYPNIVYSKNKAHQSRLKEAGVVIMTDFEKFRQTDFKISIVSYRGEPFPMTERDVKCAFGWQKE